jgi:hypothetical protein
MHTLVLIAALLAGSPSPEAKECFDWAAVGRVTRVTYVGLPQAAPDEIPVDAVWEWDFEVRQAVIGTGLPKQLKLLVASHTAQSWTKTRRMAVFLAGGHGAGPMVVMRQALNRRSHGALLEQINQIAAQSGLERCKAEHAPRPNEKYGSMKYGAFLERLSDLNRINSDPAASDEERKRAQAELTEMWNYLKGGVASHEGARLQGAK